MKRLAQRDFAAEASCPRFPTEDRNLILLKEVEGHSVEELAADDRHEREYD